MAARDVRIRDGFRLGLAHLGYAAIAFVFLLPLWWAVVSSLRPNASVFADVFPFTAKALAPSPASLEAYEGIVQAGFGSDHPQHASCRGDHDHRGADPQCRGRLRIRDFRLQG